MQNRGERFENDTLPRILQTVTFRLILVLSIQRLDLDVVEEGIAQRSQTLDCELDICNRQL